jgi:hypothetical protein
MPEAKANARGKTEVQESSQIAYRQDVTEPR